jgi:hypothetical protein
VWFDAASWLQDHLADGLPGWRVSPEDDAGAGRTGDGEQPYPLCLWSLLLTEVDPRGLWAGNVTLNVLTPVQEAPDRCRQVGELVASWRPPGPAADVELLSFTPRDTAAREGVSLSTFIYSILWTT